MGQGQVGREGGCRGRRARREEAEGRPAGARGRARGPRGPVRQPAHRLHPPPAANAPGPLRALPDPPRPQLGRVSRIFHWGKPAGGIEARPLPRPWKRRAEEGWCIGEAKVSPFCSAVGGSRGRRRVSALRRAPAGSGGGGPAALGCGGCGPRDARGGGGAGWGKGGGASGPAPAG